jgi:predicted Rossmann-fold nucleotide-binding protein
VTCGRIVELRGVTVNRWVSEEVHYPTLEQRLLHLVKENVGIVVLPGGVGTLSEFALAWRFLQAGEMPPRPLVVLGELWPEVLATVGRPEYVPGRDLSLVHFAASPAEAVAYLQQHARPADS